MGPFLFFELTVQRKSEIKRMISFAFCCILAALALIFLYFSLMIKGFQVVISNSQISSDKCPTAAG